MLEFLVISPEYFLFLKIFGWFWACIVLGFGVQWFCTED